jgi:hypothetical protein
MNSIAIYTIANSMRPEMRKFVNLTAQAPSALLNIRGTQDFWPTIFSEDYLAWLRAPKPMENMGGWWPVVMAVAVLGLHWGICWWLYRKKIFFKV